MAGKKKLSDKRRLRDFFTGFLQDRRIAAPACRHFGECGGCEFQDTPYPLQLDAKRAAFDFIVRDVIRDWRERAAAGEEGEAARALLDAADRLERTFGTLEPDLVASPREMGYRQRMDYVFAFGRAGLRRANRHRQVVELEECPLLGQEGFAVLREARKLADQAGLESYDYLRHTGRLRYFVIRRSRSGQILLSLVTKHPEDGPEAMAILHRLVDQGRIVSGHWLLADGLGDVSFGRPMGTAGQPWIVEEMNGLRLRIGPNTFFQSNPDVAELAYRAIRDFCPAGGSVLDMYSGVGSIAVNVAPGAGRVKAVENVPENVALAEVNIRDNGLDNVELIQEDASRHLHGLAEDPGRIRPDLLVVNPPRPGVEGEGMAAIRRLAPARLAYLSCNPYTLFRNLAPILDVYAPRSFTVYDMFPQTRHFETLALLEKRVES